MKKLLLIFLTLHSLLLLNAQIPEVEHTDCNGTITGKCTSNCTTYEIIHIIRPPRGEKITLSFPEFNVGSGNGYIVVADGDNINAPDIGTYDNDNPPPAKITSSGNGLLIYFIYSYDSEHQNDGWVAEYVGDCINFKDTLIAYYPFNTNACDASGNGKNTKVANATLCNDRLGNDNNAYYFNGTNSLIYLPKPLLTNNTAFAISCWVKVNGNNFAPNADYGQTIIDLRGQYQIALSYYETDHPTNPNSFGFYTYSSPNTKAIFTPNNSVQLGTWYHLLANYGNNTMEFYVNGALIGTSSQNPPGSVCCYNNTIGKDYNLNMNRCWFYGSIDEVIFYNRNLVSCEIQSLYRIGLSERDIAPLYGPIDFSYDGSGNRTSRNVIRLKSAFTIDIAKDSSYMQELAPFNNPEFYENSNDSYTVKIYPNPTHGELKVEITNFDFSKKSGIYIYNLTGSLISQKSPVTGLDIIDLQTNANGMYLMKIVLGDKTSEWTIIKE